MSLIPERLWALLTDEEKSVHRAFLDGAGHSVTVSCPECAHPFDVRLKLTAKVHSRAATTTQPAPPAVARPATPVPAPETADARLIDAAERSGILDAFRTTCDELKVQNRPPDVRAFFLQWAARKQPISANLAPPVIKQIAGALVDGDGSVPFIEFLQWGGVVGVVAHRELRLFVPYDYIKGMKGDERLGVRLSSERSLERWVRGKFGYVPAESRGFQEALRERSVGGFARLNQ